MKHKGKKILSLLLAVLMLVGLAVPSGILAPIAWAADDDEPADPSPSPSPTVVPPENAKIRQDNGDGTYTLALSVTGDAEKKVNKTNVIMILDASNSMYVNNTGTQIVTFTATNTNVDNLYGTEVENPDPNDETQYFQLYRTGIGGNSRYYTDEEHNNEYTGQRYSRAAANQTRMAATLDAMEAVAEALLKHNTIEGNPSDTVELALVAFAPDASIAVQPTTDFATFKGSSSSGAEYYRTDHDYHGTNWEAALQLAPTVDFGEGDNDPTYVIFFTDGLPTRYVGQQGTAYDTEAAYPPSLNDARAIVTGGMTLYSIFAFGDANPPAGSPDGGQLLNGLTNYAYTESETGTPDGEYFYEANNTSELQEAFNRILSQIEMAGIGTVGMEDGTPGAVPIEGVSQETEVISLLTVDPNSFKYYRAGGVGADGTSEKYVSSTNKLTTTHANGTEESVNIGVEWVAKNPEDPDDPNPPTATVGTDGTVKWDLSSLKVLEDGVKYTVTFKCYPSQATLDYVADIKNDPYVDENNPGAWGDLPESVQKYITPTGGLITNTTTKLSWIDTREENPTTHETTINEDLGALSNDAIEQLAIGKDWLNLLETEWKKPDSVTLNVMRDTDPHYTVVLNNGNQWKDTVYISIGIMGADGKPLTGAEGHDFSFKEDASSGYKWQINAPTVHPMLIGNKAKMLIKVDDKHPLPDDIDEADVYTFNDATYYLDEEVASLTAVNERRSSINLVKVVDGEDAPEDAIFPFTINVVDPLAPDSAPTNDPEHNSDYWIWISIWDKDKEAVTEGALVSGATHDGGSWYYGVSGKDIVLNVKAGYSIRINNLPTGTTYTITEGDLPSGFVFDKSAIALTEGDQNAEWAFTPGKTSTGSVDTTNAVFTITYTNKYSLADVEITKVWDDNDDELKLRPTADEFKAKLTLKADGTDVTSANEDKLSVTADPDDENKYIVKWTGLTRYSGEKEIEYTVEESAIDNYSTSGSPAKDHGTITNWNVPVDTNTTSFFKKTVSAPNSVKPSTFEFTISGSTGAPMPMDADGNQITTGSVTFNANETGNKPIDFGKIVFTQIGTYTYTITETTVPDGWTATPANKTATVTVEVSGDVENGYEAKVTGGTITNAYAATGEAVLEVTKALEGAEWPEGKTLTLTLSGTGGTLPATTTATLSAEGTAKFAAITYTEADIDKEYTYTISEDGFGEGWTGSGNVTATVKVTDNGNGTLKTDIQYSSNGTITNTYVAEGTAVLQAKKVLEGRDWLEGESFTFALKDADGKTIEEKTVTKDSVSVAFTAIEYTEADAGKTFTYTITETGDLPFHVTKSEDITATVKVTDAGGGKLTTEVTYSPEDFTITNTYDDEKTTIEVTKVWNDNSDQDGKRPEEVTFTVTGSDENTYETTFSGKGDTWTAEVEVSKYTPDGEEVTFTVDEDTVPNYSDKAIDNDTLTITNSYTPGKTTLTVTKIWDDNGDQDGKRPDKVTFKVTGSDGHIYTATLSGEGDEWTAEIKNVDQYMNGGEDVTFTVEEETVAGYTPTIDNDTLTITNTHTADTIDISGKKTWDDGNDQDGKRPDSITVNLLANGKKVDSKTVTAKDDWKYTFSGLQKNDNGKAITYTITEEAVEGYNTTVKGYDITNTYNPEEQTVTVNKVWDDNDNQDGVRPDSITVYLKQGETVCDTQILSESNGWEFTWEGLPKKQAGKDLTYTVEEDTDSLGDLYEAQEPEVSGSIFTITNTHEPEKLKPFTVTKVWNDDNNKTGKRPSSVTVTLLADGKSVATATLTEANGWTYTFEDLPKYEKGKEIKYTLKEATVSGYTSAVTGNTTNGFTVTNTVKDDTPPSPPPVIRIEIVKVWEDDSNASGTRTETVEVTLLKGGVKNLTRDLGDSNEWKYEGYVEAGYDYKVVETPVEGYESIVTQSSIPGGIRFTVVNKLTKTPELNTEDHVAYIVGYPDGTVRPGKEITRAEVATIFFRLLTEEARDKYWSQTNPYPDVKLDDWFNNAISTLTNMGIINGYEDGTFRPNNPITRAELTKMAVSFFSSADQYFGKTPSFSDVPADAWYTRFIAAAEALGLINGYPDGTFRPTNYITRAETCTIVNRTLGRGPHKDHLLPYAEMINWPDNTPDAWYYAQIQEASNSHDYDWITEQIENTTVEQWLAKLPERDWVALEQIWSNSHSAPGGEVMG